MRSRLVLVIGLVLGAVVAAIAGIILAQAWSRRPALPPTAATVPGPVARLEYVPVPIGASVAEFGRPLVTNVAIVDLDRDGLPDVLYCEAQSNTVRWIRQAPRGVFTEQIIGRDISAPAHVAAADLNGTGRLDVLVASMGQIMPNNDRIGAVVVLENLGDGRFGKRVLLDHVARVSDVRAANLTGHTDGRLDLVVGQFGYDQGETRWLENHGDWQFAGHVVNTQSGCIHTPVADFDGDGKLDFAALVSQEWEEVHLFRQTGSGEFRDAILWGSTNEDYGSSGLDVADVNGDGRPDLIYTNGDGFDYSVRGPRPWHGLQWLENTGGGHFAFHRVGNLPGAYGPCAADLNGDGLVDLLAVSCFADWSDPNAVSMMAWLNDGRARFRPVVLAHQPTHLVTAAVGDLDGNGVPVIVTGGFHAFAPYDHMSSVTLWRRK
ncbi:MAG TPA: VCBS repeat-containing protein [Opitutus sp.]|nr:VCBS repeat-containing protein [Opitutus sp.]